MEVENIKNKNNFIIFLISFIALIALRGEFTYYENAEEFLTFLILASLILSFGIMKFYSGASSSQISRKLTYLLLSFVIVSSFYFIFLSARNPIESIPSYERTIIMGIIHQLILLNIAICGFLIGIFLIKYLIGKKLDSFPHISLVFSITSLYVLILWFTAEKGIKFIISSHFVAIFIIFLPFFFVILIIGLLIAKWKKNLFLGYALSFWSLISVFWGFIFLSYGFILSQALR